MLNVIGERQQAMLRLLLQHKEGMTIDQMATALAITRTAVREHVSALEREQLVVPAALTSTGGRPSRSYALSSSGHALFPKHYDMLARLLLGHMVEKLGGKDAEKELRALGARLARDLKGRMAGGTLEDKARSIAALLGELGYETTSPAPGSRSREIEALNCVFHELAQADQRVCALDIALIETLADAQVEHRSCMARGDNSCRFCLKGR